jgi:hypothetical protein
MSVQRILTFVSMLMMGSGLSAQTPQPFPGAGQPQSKPAPPAPQPPAIRPGPAQPAPAPTPAPAPQAAATDPAAPTPAQLGFPVYPNAQFITSYDAGRGQRYYLFGASAPFAELVQYYRTTLKERGNLVFEQPPTHMFEVGRFREESMAFPPGVTVKDYSGGMSGGYPNPRPDAQPARFATIIQIVPAPPPAAPARK